jgi:hypothetical protein
MKIVGLVVGMMLAVSVAWAGEKEELAIKKQLIETQFQVLQLQIDKQFGEQTKKLQGEYKIVTDKLAAMEPKKEPAKKVEPKK